MRDFVEGNVDYRTIRQGDRIWAHGAQGCFGETMDARWYLVHVGRHPRQMRAAKRHLDAEGANNVWFPTETRRRAHRGKRVPYEVAIAPGLLFVQVTRAPIWSVLEARWRIRPMRWGVWSPEGTEQLRLPVTLTDRVIAQMAECPDHLQALQRAVAEARAAERRAKRPSVGDRAVICEGLMAGFEGEVVSVIEGQVVLEIQGCKVSAPTSSVERAC